MIAIGASQVAQVKESFCNAGDTEDAGLIPGSERHPGGGHGNPLQYSCLENPWTKEHGGLQSIASQSWTSLKQLSMQAEIIAIDTSLLYLSSNIHDLNCCSPICPCC